MSASNPPIRKRFIAGAKCPACHLEDKIQMFQEHGKSVYQCVACGHKETENYAAHAEDEAVHNEEPEVLEQPLQFFPAPPKKAP